MSELNLINLAEVESKEVKWLWKPYLPAGKITILRDNPGEGKTMLALSIIAALTTGAPLFGEDEQREPVCCIYQSAEDGIADTIKPRLEAAGADCSKVRIIDESKSSLSFTDDRIEQADEREAAGARSAAGVSYRRGYAPSKRSASGIPCPDGHRRAHRLRDPAD